MHGKKIASKVLQKIRAQMEEVELEEGKMKELVTKHMDASHDYATAAKKAKKELQKEETQSDMLDTALSDVAQSPKGEVYSKSKEKTTAPSKPTGTATHVVAGKSGEAYNATPLTKRMPALESAIRSVMDRTHELKKIHAESAQIAIVSPAQREDWMNVERGMMNVVDYFNKYRVTGEE